MNNEPKYTYNKMASELSEALPRGLTGVCQLGRSVGIFALYDEFWAKIYLSRNLISLSEIHTLLPQLFWELPPGPTLWFCSWTTPGAQRQSPGPHRLNFPLRNRSGATHNFFPTQHFFCPPFGPHAYSTFKILVLPLMKSVPPLNLDYLVICQYIFKTA